MKRWALAIALLAAAAAPAWGQLQTTGASNGFSGATKSLAATLPKATTAGTWILVQVESTCTALPQVTDSVGRTYVLDASQLTPEGVSAWHAVNTTVGTTTVKVAFVNCFYAAMQAEEGAVGGVDTKATLGTAALAGTTFTIGNVTASGADLIIAAAHDNFGIGGLTAGSGFTLINEAKCTGMCQSPAGGEYRNVTSGVYSAAFGAKTGYKYTGVAVAYSPSGVTPPPPPNVCSSTGTLSVNGSGTPLTMAQTFTMPAGTVGVAYSASIATAASVTGGVPPYTYAVTSGALPSGLTMSTAGLISGTPTASGTTSFVVTVTDSSGLAMDIDFHQKIALQRRLQGNECIVDNVGDNIDGSVGCVPIAAETPR